MPCHMSVVVHVTVSDRVHLILWQQHAKSCMRTSANRVGCRVQLYLEHSNAACWYTALGNYACHLEGGSRLAKQLVWLVKHMCLHAAGANAFHHYHYPACMPFQKRRMALSRNACKLLVHACMHAPPAWTPGWTPGYARSARMLLAHAGHSSLSTKSQRHTCFELVHRQDNSMMQPGKA